MAAVHIRRDTSLLKNAAEQRDQAVGVNSALSEIPPAIHLPEHGPAGNAGNCDPVDVRLHGTQLLESRCMERRSQVLPIAFCMRQLKRDAGAGLCLGVFDLQAS